LDRAAVKEFAPIVSLAATFAIATAPVASAAPTATVSRVTWTSRWHRPSPDPTGIAYERSTRKLLVVDSEVEETGWYDGANVWLKRLPKRRPSQHWSTLSFSKEPTDVAVGGPRTLFFTDDNRHRIFRVHPGPDGTWGTQDDVVSSFPTSAFGTRDAEGLVFARLRRHRFLYVVSGKAATVYRLSPGPDGSFDGVAPVGDDIVSASFSTDELGLANPKGIAFDPGSKLLYIVGHDQQLILRTRLRGRLVDSIDISSSGITHPSGVALAPGSKDPSAKHVYVTDWGRRHENDGRIFEFALS
jgi:hypothetical protein